MKINSCKPGGKKVAIHGANQYKKIGRAINKTGTYNLPTSKKAGCLFLQYLCIFVMDYEFAALIRIVSNLNQNFIFLIKVVPGYGFS